MDKQRQPLDLKPVKGGWAAFGDGWTVHGKTEDEAVRLYYEAVERHRVIDARSPDPAQEVAVR